MTVTRTPQVIHRGQTKPVLKVALGKVGFPVTGLVKVGSRGVVRAKELTDGVATFTLPAYGSTGEKAVRVRYLGSDLTEALTQRVVIRVVR